METLRKFIYLVKINVGPKKLDFVIENDYEVDNNLIFTMAGETVEKYLSTFKSPQENTPQALIDHKVQSLRDETQINIEELTELPRYNLQIKFKNGAIANRPVIKKRKPATEKQLKSCEDGRKKIAERVRISREQRQEESTTGEIS